MSFSTDSIQWSAARGWHGHSRQPSVGSNLVICPQPGDEPVGFASAGPVRDEGDGSALGELYAINLDPDVWGRGLGRELLGTATDELRRLGFDAAVLWVATGNARALRFYEAAGWQRDGIERTNESFGPAIQETRYRRALVEPTG